MAATWFGLALAYLVAVLTSGGAAALSWRRRRRTPSALALAVMEAAITVWCVVDLCIAFAGLGWLPLNAARAAWGVVLPMIAVVAAAFWVISRSVADDDWRPRAWSLAALAIHPTLVSLILVSPRSDLLYRPGTISPDGAWLTWTPGPLFGVHTGYSYGLYAWSGLALLAALRRVGALLRRQIIMLLVCFLIPIPCTMIATALNTGAAPDLTGVGFALTGLIATRALLRHGFAELVPIARSLVLERLTDAVLVMDVQHRLLDVNEAGRQLLALIEPDLTTFETTRGGVVVEGLLGLGDLAETGAHGEHRVRLGSGDLLVLDLRTDQLVNARGRPLGYVLVARDVTELVGLRDDLAERAVRDDLTGLYNRRELMCRLEEALAHAVRRGTDLALLMIDVDHFKSVNDEHGHAVGDALLRATSQALLEGVRADDVVARLGGEEFVVLLPGISTEEALNRAEQLRRGCAAATVPTAAESVVGAPVGYVGRTVSVGVAGLRARPGGNLPVDTGASLLRAADQALYEAKRSGRDRVNLAA